MSPGKSRRRRAAICALAALALAGATTPLHSAAADRLDTGELSPRLAELAKPAVRSAGPVRQAEDLELAVEGPGSLLRQGDRVLVEVRFDQKAAAGVDDLRAAGAEPIDLSRRYQTVTVAVRPAELTALPAIPGVAAVTEVLSPLAAASTCPAGVFVSEGDQQLRAQEARSAFGVDGSGVEVGILSDAFDQDGSAETHASEDVESGDLPGVGNTCPGQSTAVDVLEDFSDPQAADEGRAMAQIVHDLAPGAQLSFATAFTGLTAFAGNVKDLAAAGAEVIADDVSYFEEPFFQEGPVGVAVREVSEDGVSYFSSAGNNNLIDAGRNVASWEAPQFRDAACPTGVPAYATHCMDFDPGAGADSTFGLTVSAGVTLTLDLQWAQPWKGVTTDLDAYLLNSGNAVLAKSENFNVPVTQKPFEFLSWENSAGAAQAVRVAFNRCDLVCDGTNGGDIGTPRLKLALLQNGGGVTETEYPEAVGGDVVGPTIFGHNGATDAVSVGAVRFDTAASPEAFSSRGPVTHYFGPVNGATPAAPLAEPLVLSKPDVAATDGGANTFFGSLASGVWRFFGTSASAPHAAAVAALMLDGNPGLAPAEVRDALAASAHPVGAFGPDAVGAGLVDALGALSEVAEPVGPGGGGSEEGVSAPPGEAGGTGAGAETQVPRSAGGSKPRTFILRHPATSILTRQRAVRALFRFGASESDVTFLCRVDRGRFRQCPARFVRRYAVGRHVVRVKARDAAGNTDPTPAVFRFRVVRLRD